MSGQAERIEPASVSTHTFDWGAAKWFVTPDRNSAALTFGEVVVMPGGGHSRHNHPDAEETWGLTGRRAQPDRTVAPLNAT